MVYLLLRGLLLPLQLLPLPMALWVGRRCGDIGYYLLFSRRRVVNHNLRVAWGDALTSKRRRRLGRSAFQNIAMVVIENLQLPRLTRRGELGRILETRGDDDNLRNLGEQGTAGILISGHLGAWELLPSGVASLGVPMMTPVRTLRNPYVARWMNRNRSVSGQEMVFKSEALGAIRTALRGDRSVGVLLDQNHRRGVFVEFFGHEAKTNPVVGMLLRQTGAPVFAGYVRRVVPGRRYEFRVTGPLDFGALEGRAREQAQHVAQVCTRQLQEYVEESPEQWFWLHQRWKDRPDGTRERIRE